MPPWPPTLTLAVRDLRAAGLPRFSVRLGDLTGEQALATCHKGRSHGRRCFILTLHRPLVYAYPPAVIPLLCHEAAHILAPWCGPDHGRDFGIAYARIWKLLHPAAPI